MPTVTKRPPDRSKLRPQDVTPLGRADGWTFVEYAGQEFVLDPATPAGDTSTAALRPDQVRILEHKTRTEFGTVTEYQVAQIGTRVATGSYAAALEREDRRGARTRRSRRVDAMRDLPFLRSGAPIVLPSPGRGVALRGSQVTDVLATGKGGYAPGRGPARDPEARRARLLSKGYSVALSPTGRLDVSAPGGRMTSDVREYIALDARFLVAHLTGTPLLCEVHPGERHPAYSTTIGGDVACAAWFEE